MKKQLLTIVGALAFVGSVQADTITFDSDTQGLKGDGFTSVHSANVRFYDTAAENPFNTTIADSNGIGIKVQDIISGDTDANELWLYAGASDSGLEMIFSQDYNFISMSYGNDSTPLTGQASLWLFNNGVQVAHILSPFDGNQRTSAQIGTTLTGGQTYDRAVLFYVNALVTPGMSYDFALDNSATYMLDRAEVIDNLGFNLFQDPDNENPVPEVQHYAGMLGAVLAGAEMLRRRRKA